MAKSDLDFDIIDPKNLSKDKVNENTPMDPEISKDDFKFVQADASIHEQKFVTKPTTFLKDSFKRFTKNKSSVVAACLLGFLLLLSVFVPLFDPYDVSKSNPDTARMEPKLFDAGTGFWDGTKHWDDVPTDISDMPDAKTPEEKDANWWPNPGSFIAEGVKNKEFSDIMYTDKVSKYGSGGYIKFGCLAGDDSDYVSFTSYTWKDGDIFDVNRDKVEIAVFDTFDLEKLKKKEGKNELTLPENYELAPVGIYFEYKDENDNYVSIQVLDDKVVHNIGTYVEGYPIEPSVDVNAKIKATVPSITQFKNARFSIKIKNLKDGKNYCSLFSTLTLGVNTTEEYVKDYIYGLSFADATQCLSEDNNPNNLSLWNYPTSTVVDIYLSKTIYCSFTYDCYEALLGKKIDYNFKKTDLEGFKAKGWISYSNLIAIDDGTGHYYVSPAFKASFKILDEAHCPLTGVPEPYFIDDTTPTFYIKAEYYQYKKLGFSSMPRFIFGTDNTGRDLLKYVFEGLRTSLLLGIATFIVCFSFGLIWGAISGYYGGNVDLVMERLTDILAGIPWIVCMTLFIKKLGQNFITFALALCFTGWIGTAATTRTQFYRFRGREYVLASRTLGASNSRLIFKHILPNSLGTIITGAVLMIPSVIFSEATISYLGLGLQGMSSLGVILSNNQAYLEDYPYMLIFPAIVIALIMISFNLFGNGLRDAINPSLKGEEQ